MSRALWVPLLCVALLALAPASAHAAIANTDDNGNPFAQGEPGESNDMSVRPGGDGVIISDTAGIRPQDGAFACRALSPTEVTCLGDAAILRGGDGNDVLRDSGLTTGFGARGGPGDDQIFAGTAPAILFGDDSRVRPDDGNDTIVGSTAAVPGGTADGKVWDDDIDGGGGNDTIDGREGADHVSGQTGNDTVRGGDGPDSLDTTTLLTEDEQDVPGDAGDDTLDAGAGNDVIFAVAGKDKADGGDGDDYLMGIDDALAEDDNASDSLTCGAGTDRVSAGSKDKIAVGCETLRVRLYCAPGPGTCKATGTLTGKAKGAKKTSTVGKLSSQPVAQAGVNFSLGKKATKVLGSQSKVSLTVNVIGRRGKSIVGSRYFKFSFVKG